MAYNMHCLRTCLSMDVHHPRRGEGEIAIALGEEEEVEQVILTCKNIRNLIKLSVSSLLNLGFGASMS